VFRHEIDRSGFAVDLGPPPADADEQEAPVVEEFGRLAFEGVANELEGPSHQKQSQRVKPQPMKEDAGHKKRHREQNGGYPQRVAHAVHRMLVTGAVLRDPLLVAASAKHAEDDIRFTFISGTALRRPVGLAEACPQRTLKSETARQDQARAPEHRGFLASRVARESEEATARESDAH
jgi:hypothetical protein